MPDGTLVLLYHRDSVGPRSVRFAVHPDRFAQQAMSCADGATLCRSGMRTAARAASASGRDYV